MISFRAAGESARSPSAAQTMDAGFVHRLSVTAGVWMAERGVEAKTDSNPKEVIIKDCATRPDFRLMCVRNRRGEFFLSHSQQSIHQTFGCSGRQG